jgi:hypothetical protein
MCKQEKDEKILLYCTTTQTLRRSSLASLSYYPPTNLERLKFPRRASEVSITLNGVFYKKVKLGMWERAGRLLGLYKEFLICKGYSTLIQHRCVYFTNILGSVGE